MNTFWDGVAKTEVKVDVAEYRLNLKNFNLTTPCAIFNLALYHHWVDLPSGASDFGWPSNQWYDQPRTWQPVVLGGTSCGTQGSVAYVFRGDVAAALSFYNLLTVAGYNVALVPLNTVLVTNFSTFNLILIADDTGSLNQWGTPGASQTVDFSVTPPAAPAILGTGCHIDLQGWIGTTLIGGIRKLDLPPVHLPENVQPPWEEPEITFRPEPPVAGVPGQICVQLGNPLDADKSVTLDFAVADFGAGIGFTPVGSQGFVIPARTLNNYCIPWTPPTTGTLHRCVLVTLRQAGFQDERSQRNVELRAAPSGDLSTFIFPFVAGNPDLADHVATFERRLVGINPLWDVIFEMGNGSGLPPSLTIPGGGQVALRLRFVMLAGALAPLPPVPLPPDFYYGSESSLEVTLLLDGLPSGGFSLHLVPYRVYAPVIKK